MESLDNKCPGCAAPIKFNPIKQCWSCEYCGSNFTLEEMQKYTNASSEKVNIKQEEVIKTEEVDSYHCKNCGAVILSDEYTTSTFCVYCGSTAILKERIQNNRVPDMIIPFKKVKEDAINVFKQLSKGRPLMPKFFNKPENIEKIKGVYIPFWLYDMNVDGGVNLEAKDVKRWSSGNTDYVKTNIYNLYREGSMDFIGIPVDASTRFTDDIMNTIEPFDYKDLIHYNHAYLSGFLAEKYDVETDKASLIAASRAIETAKSTVKNDSRSIKYESIRIKNDSLVTKTSNYKYILLPVWMVNVKYNNKMYLFAMNGQTGEFVGNIPLDIKKTILYSIIIFIISVIVCIIISYIAYGG